jgi:cytosine/uracil/thiamine/allantoin permease
MTLWQAFGSFLGVFIAFAGFYIYERFYSRKKELKRRREEAEKDHQRRSKIYRWEKF